MLLMVERLTRQPTIILVEAAVHEEQQYIDEQTRRDRDEQRGRNLVVRTPPGAMRLGLRVVLSAVLSDGRRITADNCFGIGGPPGMLRPEVDELIHRMLGRDAGVHRPPKLSWDALISALEDIGVISSEPELITTRLEIRLEPSAHQALTLD
jgi:hypothetical protein